MEIGFIDFNNLGIFRFQKVLICSIARIQNYNRGNSILGRFFLYGEKLRRGVKIGPGYHFLGELLYRVHLSGEKFYLEPFFRGKELFRGKNMLQRQNDQYVE